MSIASRRREADDPDLEFMPDDPLGVVGYVVRHHRVPDVVTTQDVRDALMLLAHIQEYAERYTLELIDLAQRSGTPLGDLASPLGVRGKAGVWALRQRLDEQFRGDGRRDEKAATRRYHATRKQQEWNRQHGSELLAIAMTLVRWRDEFPDPEVQDTIDEIDSALSACIARPSGELIGWFWVVLNEITDDDAYTDPICTALRRGRVLQKEWKTQRSR